MPRIEARTSAVYAMSGDVDAALELLVRAESRGYRRYELLEKDPVWERLRDEPEFEQIVARMRDAVRKMRDGGEG